MHKKALLFFLLVLLTISVGIAQREKPDTIKTDDGNLIIQPILHSALVLRWNDEVIYVDPYGGAGAYKGIAAPTLILITDIHSDHTNLETLKELDTKNATFVVPPAVAKLLKKEYEKQLVVIKNKGISALGSVLINAIPMYNLPEDNSSKHPRGRGNGYVLKLGGKSIYISGDTEDIPEMRNLHRIDIAFVCMNLPYTMDIQQAADAVLAFKPKIVYPFHYRGKPDMSDIAAFKKLVNAKNKKIDVRLRNWYP